MIVVQIGTNRAYDDLTDMIAGVDVSKLILVEPIHFHNEKILECYGSRPNVVVENIAISIDPADTALSFYLHSNDGPKYEVASVDIEHVAKHYGHDKSGIFELKVNSLTINELFDKHSLQKIDILFIDAEGIDDKIIKSINFDKFDISKIYFENLHLTEQDIYQFLQSKGYGIVHRTGTNGWCSLAQK